MIRLKTIPSNLRKPGSYIEFDVRSGQNGLPRNQQLVLLVAQRLAAGTKPAGTPVQIFSEAEAKDYFGAGSIAAVMVGAALNAYKLMPLYVLPVDDADSSVAAAGSLVVGGSAGNSGSLTLYIGDKAVTVNAAQSAALADIASALAAAIGNLPELPVTASANSGTLTITAKNKGTLGNQLKLSAETTITGLTLSVTAMTGGTLDPDMATALAAIAGQRFHIIASSFNSETALAALQAHLASMASAQKQKAGLGLFAYPSGALAAACTLGGTLNGWLLSGKYLRGTKSWTPRIAAVYAAIAASEEDPAMPLNTLEMPGIAAPSVADRLSSDEQETCLANGVSPLEVASDGTVRIVRAITTYTKDASNVADATLLDISTPRSLFYLRDSVEARLTQKFGQAKNSAKAPTRVETEVRDVMDRLEAAEIIQNVAANPPHAERNASSPTQTDIEIPADVVPGLHVIAGSIKLIH